MALLVDCSVGMSLCSFEVCFDGNLKWKAYNIAKPNRRPCETAGMQSGYCSDV